MSNNIQDIIELIIEGKQIVQAVVEGLKNYEEQRTKPLDFSRVGFSALTL